MKATETEADSEERLRLIAKLSGLYAVEPSGSLAAFFDATIDVPVRWLKRACVALRDQRRKQQPSPAELRAACLDAVCAARCYFQGRALEAVNEDVDLAWAEMYETGYQHLLQPKRLASAMQRRQGA